MIIDYVKSVTSRIFAMNDTADTRVDNGSKSLLFGQIKFHIFTNEDFGDESANEVRILNYFALVWLTA